MSDEPAVEALQATVLAAGQRAAPALMPALTDAVVSQLSAARHGDLAQWAASVARLPLPLAILTELEGDAPTSRVAGGEELSALQRDELVRELRQLGPWRKGPFHLHGVELDGEWRCSLKWQRFAQHVQLQGARLLDVGSGNGYYCLRALGAGARCALGIDPTLLYVAQFAAVQRYFPDLPAAVLPFTLEEFPVPQPGFEFDVVLSFGVLSHRRSPQEHLRLLLQHVRPGGTLALETLVLTDEHAAPLVPTDRYAGMRNVWCVPPLPVLNSWLTAAGFVDVRVVDITVTTSDEQRVTPFSGPRSLTDVLSNTDPALTIEGYPRPTRAMLLARRA